MPPPFAPRWPRAIALLALLYLYILRLPVSGAALRGLLPPVTGGYGSASGGDGRFRAVIVDSDYGDWLDDPFALATLHAIVGEDLKLVITTGARESALLAAQLLLQGSAADGGTLPTVAQGLTPAGFPRVITQPTDTNNSTAPRLPSLAGALDPELRPALESMVLSDGLSAAAGVVEEAVAASGQQPAGQPLVLWLVIGPATNAAAFAAAYPQLTPHVRIGIMGGSSRPGIPLPWGNGCCTTPIVEFNVATDVAAAQAVLAAPWAALPNYAPIDSTHDSALRGVWYQRLLHAAFPGSACRAEFHDRMALAGSPEYCTKYGCRGYALTSPDCHQPGRHPMAAALLTTYLAWLNEAQALGPASPAYDEALHVARTRTWTTATPPLYDVFAAAELLAPELFVVQRQRMAVAEDGATSLLRTGGTPVDWGWDCPRPDAVWDTLMRPFLADAATTAAQ